MTELTLGAEVPTLTVILHRRWDNEFAVTLDVPEPDLDGLTVRLDLGQTSYAATRDGATFSWVIPAAEVVNRPASEHALLYAESTTARTVLASGSTSVRS